ncbi:TetR/AcrR family transcriptional regulator [Emcibacter nanhaiensis]|nr:TetR family transcriptional regulator [Emcibacter nanhaiensis]
MAKKRRMGAEDSEVRAKLIKAAAEVLKTEGYASFSARKVGARAGLTPQLLYYYFKTMDDLLIAVIREFNEIRHVRLQEALESADPLRAIWELNIDNDLARLTAELTSIAARHEKARLEVIDSADQLRKMQIEAVSKLLPREKTSEDQVSASEALMVGVALARLLVTEDALGFSAGHEEVLNFVERMLARYRQDETGKS